MAGNTSTLGFGSLGTTSIINYYSSGGVNSGASLSSGSPAGGKKVLSGALTANTLATALSVTGQGEVPWLAMHTEDATARTLRMKVTVDGTAVFDATTSSISASGYGQVAVGAQTAANLCYQSTSPLRFKTSLLVEIASSVSETDKVSISYVLNKG